MSRLILTYHSLTDEASEIAVAPSRFSAQVHQLARAGYKFETVSSITEPSDAIRRVALCFDDGFESVARMGLPVLEAAGGVATVFPIVGALGRRARWTDHHRPLISEPMLDAQGLTDLSISGWEIASHGWSHRCLLTISPATARDELRRSRAELEDRLGIPIRGFAYPQGCWSRTVVNLVRDSGYQWACSTLAISPVVRWCRWLLPRVTVGRSTSPIRFRATQVRAARLLRAVLPGRDSVFRSGHRHEEQLDSTTFIDRA